VVKWNIRKAKNRSEGNSFGVLTNPAKTGFCSIDLLIFSNEAELRTQRSYDSSCQNRAPVQLNERHRLKPVLQGSNGQAHRIA
jgi:hypothetical protein